MNLLSTAADAASHQDDSSWSGASLDISEREGIVAPILLQYWHALLRWRWVVGGIILACFAIGLVWTLLTPPRYTARAELEIAREQKQITNVQGLDSASAGQDLEFYATQYALVKARPVAERVARDLRLVSDPLFYEAHGLDPDEIEEDNPGTSKRELAQMRERLVVKTLLDNVSISPVRTSRLVDISYTARSAELAAKITNAWAQAFLSTNMDRQFASTADARRFLEDRLSSLRDKLEQSERNVVTYASQQGIISLEQGRDPDGRAKPARTCSAACAGLDPAAPARPGASANASSASATMRMRRDIEILYTITALDHSAL